MPRLRLLVGLVAAVATLAACGTPQPVGSRIPTFGASGNQPAPFDTSAFNFLVVGDWGRNGFFNQAQVGEGMGVVAARINSRFTISTGDNFYTSGVTSVDDPKWIRSFEAIYTHPALQRRWYITLGNHDWQGNVPAQIAYTQLSDRWYLPAQYYAEEMVSGADSTRALFVFLDTNPLAYRPEYVDRFDNSGVWDPEAQLTWLEQTLRESDAPWKIVVGHHPIYGSGRYPDNPLLIEALVTLFERYGVQAYISGHDHNLQHLRPEGSPVDYFISGAGSLLRAVEPSENTLFAVEASGFMAFSMTQDQMEVRAIDEDVNLLYRATVPLRRGVRLPLPFGIGDD